MRTQVFKSGKRDQRGDEINLAPRVDKLVINAVGKNKESEVISDRASAKSCESEKIIKTVSEEQSRVLGSKDTVIPRECEHIDEHTNKDRERSESNPSTRTHEKANQEASDEVINAELDDQLKRAAEKFTNELFASRGVKSDQPRERRDKSIKSDQPSESSNVIEREKDNAEGSAHEQRDDDEIVGMMSENRCFLSISLGGQDYKALFDPGAMLSHAGPRVLERYSDRLKEFNSASSESFIGEGSARVRARFDFWDGFLPRVWYRGAFRRGPLVLARRRVANLCENARVREASNFCGVRGYC